MLFPLSLIIFQIFPNSPVNHFFPEETQVYIYFQNKLFYMQGFPPLSLPPLKSIKAKKAINSITKNLKKIMQFILKDTSPNVKL